MIGKRVLNRIVKNPSEYPDEFDLEIRQSSPGVISIKVTRIDKADGWWDSISYTMYDNNGKSQVLDIGRCTSKGKLISMTTDLQLVLE